MSNGKPPKMHYRKFDNDKTTRCGRPPSASFRTTATWADVTCQQCIKPNAPFTGGGPWRSDAGR